MNTFSDPVVPSLGPRRSRHLVRLLAGGSGLVIACASVVAGVGTGSAAAGPTGTTPVGVAPDLPARATVQSAVDRGVPLQLTVGLQPRDPQGLAALARDVSNPGSPAYRHFLAPGEFARRFGATDATVKAVGDALSNLGLQPTSVAANRLALSVTTTAGRAASGFGLQLHNVRLAGGRLAYANDAAPRLPATVAPAVAGIAGLDNLSLDRPSWRRSAPEGVGAATAPSSSRSSAASAAPRLAAVQSGPQPCAAATAAATTTGGLTADQVAKAYSFGGLYTNNILGTGFTVAIYELAPYIPSDVAAFQTCYGTAAPVANVAVDGGPTPGDSGSFEVELDIEGVISMAPKANIAVYLGPNGGAGGFDVYNRIVSDGTAQVISTSWGTCEALRNPTRAVMENNLFQQAAVQGQTIIAATGDSGSEDCNPTNGSTALAVDDPAAQPFVTAVGGTKLTALGPAPTEAVWNDAATQGGAGGGGVSRRWLLPPAQHGPGVVSSYSSSSMCNAPAAALCREVPDVSASADPSSGYVVYYTGPETDTPGWQSVGGTSAAAPLWAALIALVDQSCTCSLGFVNSALYNIGDGSGAFNDVTSGNNDYLGLNGGAYPATAGFDMGSGLGTPVATNLAVQLGSRASMTYPTDGLTTVDTTQPFTWSTTPRAQAYYLIVGTTMFGYDLVNSGVLPPTQSSLSVPALPVGQTLHLTLFAEINGTWTNYQAISFTAAPGLATFTFPANGQIGIDSTRPFTWSTIPAAQGYILVVGTTRDGTDLAISGVLPPTQSSFATPSLPPNQILYATLLTKVNGAFTRSQSIVFTAEPAMATFTRPINGQLDTATPSSFTWSTIAGAQNYWMVVGTTLYGTDLVNSGLLSASTSSFAVPALPHNQLLFATLLTKVNGNWVSQIVGFTAA